jgi:hypothetical protein
MSTGRVRSAFMTQKTFGTYSLWVRVIRSSEWTVGRFWAAVGVADAKIGDKARRAMMEKRMADGNDFGQGECGEGECG